MRKAIATTRAKNQLPQVEHQITIRSEIPDRMTRRRLAIHKAQPAGLVHEQLHFTTRQPLPLVDAVTRAVQHARDLCWKVVMKKPENEDAAGLRRFLSETRIRTDLVQVFGRLQATRGCNRRPAKQAGVVVGN